MSRNASARIVLFAIAFVFAALPVSRVYAQLGHRVVHDWTVGLSPRPENGSGYDPRFRRIGLVEYEGDVDGTYVAWGFGGTMTDWSAPSIAISVGVGFGVLLIAGGLTLATFGRRGRSTV